MPRHGASLHCPLPKGLRPQRLQQGLGVGHSESQERGPLLLAIEKLALFLKGPVQPEADLCAYRLH